MKVKAKDWDHNCTGADCPVAGCERRAASDDLKDAGRLHISKPKVLKRAYVGNISFATTEEGLRAWLQPYKVDEVTIIRDHHTGRSRGFAFVEFTTPEDFEAAIKSRDGVVLDGWRVVVNDATTKRRGVR